jgi:hypothetical protein
VYVDDASRCEGAGVVSAGDSASGAAVCAGGGDGDDL